MAKSKRLTTAIRFPEELHDRLRREADEWGLSINFLVVRAVRDFMENLSGAEEITLTRSHDELDRQPTSA